MALTFSTTDRFLATMLAAIPGAWLANVIDLGFVYPVWINAARRFEGVPALPFSYGRMAYQGAFGFDRWLWVVLAAFAVTVLTIRALSRKARPLALIAAFLAVGTPYGTLTWPGREWMWYGTGLVAAGLATALWVGLSLGGALLGRRTVEALS